MQPYAPTRTKWQPAKRSLPLLGLAAFALTAHLALGADRMAEHITLTNGFDLICDHREAAGDRMKLFTGPGNANFVEVASIKIASVEPIRIPMPAVETPVQRTTPATSHADLTKAELHEMLAGAGAQHNLDEELLASVVHAESGGHTRAVSRAGAQGLMQLMPRTAAELGVKDSFQPGENVAAGTAYLDGLLLRYHDNLALALAAYNAGPAVVDRCRCVPAYRETRLYVAHIIRDYNTSVRKARLATAAPARVASDSSTPTPPPGASAP